MHADVKPVLFKHTKAWVRAYWDRLVAQGVSKDEYPFDQCWNEFCRSVTCASVSSGLHMHPFSRTFAHTFSARTLLALHMYTLAH